MKYQNNQYNKYNLQLLLNYLLSQLNRGRMYYINRSNNLDHS